MEPRRGRAAADWTRLVCLVPHGCSVYAESVQTRIVGVAVIRFDAQLDDVVQPLNVGRLDGEVLQIGDVVVDELIGAKLQWFVVVLAFESLERIINTKNKPMKIN